MYFRMQLFSLVHTVTKCKRGFSFFYVQSNIRKNFYLVKLTLKLHFEIKQRTDLALPFYLNEQ